MVKYKFRFDTNDLENDSSSLSYWLSMFGPATLYTVNSLLSEIRKYVTSEKTEEKEQGE